MLCGAIACGAIACVEARIVSINLSSSFSTITTIFGRDPMREHTITMAALSKSQRMAVLVGQHRQTQVPMAISIFSFISAPLPASSQTVFTWTARMDLSNQTMLGRRSKSQYQRAWSLASWQFVSHSARGWVSILAINPSREPIQPPAGTSTTSPLSWNSIPLASTLYSPYSAYPCKSSSIANQIDTLQRLTIWYK